MSFVSLISLIFLILKIGDVISVAFIITFDGAIFVSFVLSVA
jgi:hypothetical protein